MAYYDNVKNNIKENKDTSKPNFDTLRQAAQETSETDDKKGDNTEIEVLEDGLKQRQRQAQNQQTQQTRDQNPMKQKASQNRTEQQNSGSAEMDTTSLEKKLDRIIEQNDRMIQILESFGQ